jgi:biotin/methionine sulfoxide reductase
LEDDLHRDRFTSAHWGSYRADGDGASLRLTPLADDPKPSVIGDGWLDAVRDADTRIAAPMVRKGWLEQRDRASRNADSFIEIGWDEALDLAASELKRVASTHGNGAIYGGSYGWASAGRFHHAQSQLKRFLNTIGGYVAAVDTYSHAAAEVLLPHLTGMTNRVFQDEMTSWPLIADHCKLMVCFGGITGRTAQITSSGTSFHEVESWLARAHANGMRIVNIAPNRSEISAQLDADWIAPRPNTDTALMMGLAHCLLTQGLHDLAFLDRCCVGWPALEAYLTGAEDGTPKTPEWAGAITGIEANRIRTLAHDMAANPTMIALSWGIQRAHFGEQPLWMGLSLACMLGDIGKPGLGFGFGYGSTTPVGRSIRYMAWPSLPQGRNGVRDFIPVARVSDMLLNPGGVYTYNGAVRTYPEIRLVYWAGGNPFHHQQDLHRLEEAWTRPETVIVNDIWWTATARRADIVFPVTSPLERADIMMNRRDPSLIFMENLIEPIGGSRDDYDVFRGLAERLGVHEAFTQGRSQEAWLRELWREAVEAAMQDGVDLPDFDVFRRLGRVEVPEVRRNWLQFEAFVADPAGHPLKTRSGRIEISSATITSFGIDDCPGHPVWREPIEWLGSPDAEGMVHLVSGQPMSRLHGQLDNGPVSRANKVAGREAVYLHPSTAAAYGVTDGDAVLLENARGRALAGAVLTDNVRPNVAWIATGAWFDPQLVDDVVIDVHGNPNTLTIDIGCSGLSQGNSAHTTLVRISRWAGPLPEVEAHRPPQIERRS